ncbi:MAG: cytochrome c biogenesis protein [Chloroherpetonaceae bacterium]|nr:cytochrome c biogenesis protein [Chloroherpetonaceae bacterium]MDW8436997.1 cytochrome c biogenesis protein CcsA [Chloroherpetonaceae bacterium]
MDVTLRIFSLATPLAYIGATTAYGADFFWKMEWASAMKRPLLFLTAIVHLVYLHLLVAQSGYPPIASVFQLMSTIAFTLLVAYVFIELSTGVTETGFFALSVALTFQLVSSWFIEDAPPSNENLKNPILALHVVSALLGYGAMAIAGVYSLLYLMLLKQIQTNQFGILFERLPNLELFEKMSYNAVLFGFFFLTVAFVAGAIWIPNSNISLVDFKLIGTIVVWAVYGAGLLFRNRLALRGKRMAVMLISGFLFAFLSMTVLNFFSSRFHSQ